MASLGGWKEHDLQRQSMCDKENWKIVAHCLESLDGQMDPSVLLPLDLLDLFARRGVVGM